MFHVCMAKWPQLAMDQCRINVAIWRPHVTCWTEVNGLYPFLTRESRERGWNGGRITTLLSLGSSFALHNEKGWKRGQEVQICWVVGDMSQVHFFFFFFGWKWSTIFHRFVSIICVFKLFAYHQFIHIQDSLFIYIRFIQVRNLFVYYLFASICQSISYPYTFSGSSILPLPCLFTVLIYSLMYSLSFPNVNLLIVALYFTFNRCAIVIHEIVYAIAEHSILVVERY